MCFLGKLDEAEDAYKTGLKYDPGNAQLKDALSDMQSTRSNNGPSSFSNPFGTDVFARLQADPQTREYLKDPTYVQLVKELQSNPKNLEYVY